MRFSSLRVFTSQLSLQRDFYTRVLSLPLVVNEEEKFTVKIGASLLQFIAREEAKPNHFAINIPSFQEVEALAWLKQRVPVLPFGQDEIVDFKNWNAKAIYFYDADKNILEFIARRNLQYPAAKKFDENSLLEISEVGIGTTDIARVFHFLQTNCGLEIFDGSFDRFCAIGGEQGLFIVVDREKKEWFPTDDPVFGSAFEVLLKTRENTWHLAFENDTLNAKSYER